jgi:hypothetical protein
MKARTLVYGRRMRHVRVELHIDAPVERVFDAVSNHEVFLSSAAAGMKTTVLGPGSAERNGLGCMREVRIGRRARYVEEITAWHRPSSLEYTIRETSLPLRHEGSRIALTEASGGTDVVWTSRFEITVPILGRFLGVRAERRFAKGFTDLLLAAKARLEAAA